MSSDHSTVPHRSLAKGALSIPATLGSFAILSPRDLLGDVRKSFKVGLVGCGPRGCGSVVNLIEAAKFVGVDVKITAAADAFEDRLSYGVEGLEGHDQKIDADHRFVGFTGYKKLMATDVDIVCLVTPPAFQPIHLAAAIEAGKHVFMEMPVAVDPVGARRVMELAEQARAKKLSIVVGSQHRHSRDYIATLKAVQAGAVGKILGGSIYWCGNVSCRALERQRKPEWHDAEYMVRNWAAFSQLSGDCIVEQHCHSIDVANWFVGSLPKSAVGVGGRARRKTGNCYDFFSVDFEYPDDVHIHSMCRQINRSWGYVAEQLRGEKNAFLCSGLKAPFEIKPDPTAHEYLYVQEHVELLRSILKEGGINEARQAAETCLVAMMGREAAYTGQKVYWKQILKSDLAYTPSASAFEFPNSVTLPKEGDCPVPGMGDSSAGK